MVCPHELSISGSPINAIDLAARMHQRGHIVEVYAPPGPLLRKVESYGLPFVPAPACTPWHLPLGAVIAFAREVRRFRPDIVHTYESPLPIVSAAVSAVIPHRKVITVMAMSVPDYIPEGTPLIVGTAELATRESCRRAHVYLIEPPVDCEFDSPGDLSAARVLLGVSPEDFVVCVVGRLSAEPDLRKAEGVVSAIKELGSCILPRQLTLIIAGSGDEEDKVLRAAKEARSNPMLTVRLKGKVADPRTVYDAADVVFGMGGSALRAMAHAKPLIVQGIDGFWELLTPETVNRFLTEGFFGKGLSGGPSFTEILMELGEDPKRRAKLGIYGRQLVLERYAIQKAVDLLESIYAQEAARSLTWGSCFRSASLSLARYIRFRIAVAFPWVQRAYRSLTGKTSNPY